MQIRMDANKMDLVKTELNKQSFCWLVTGCAGFIGSNLVETLLGLGQKVTGLDNFSTGFQYNLDQVEALVGKENWKNFRFIEGDIRDSSVCAAACLGQDFVLHQAALGSVPRSVADPLITNENNITGFLNMKICVCGFQFHLWGSSRAAKAGGCHWQPFVPICRDQVCQ